MSESQKRAAPFTARQLQEAYARKENIMALLRGAGSSGENSVGAILISYDLQSGSYVRAFDQADWRQAFDRYTAQLADVIGALQPVSVLDAGVGEATTLWGVISKLPRPPAHVHGFDLAWSRIDAARRFAARFPDFQPVLTTGDLFHIPAPDASFDVVFTSHAVEPNHGREREALQELMRVARRWVVLFEPSYELGGEETQRHMEKHGYCRGLRATAEALGFRVHEHRLLDFSYVNHNRTAVLVLEKDTNAPMGAAPQPGCPTCHSILTPVRGQLFCPECLTVFPVIDGIPCLLERNAILATHYLD